MISIYLCRGMTGRIAADVVKEAKTDKAFLEAAEITVLCPVISEGLKATKAPVESGKALMDVYWYRDKAMIREANVVFDMTPHLKSFGVEHELGYARYYLYKPIVRVFPAGQLPKEGSVAYFEDDYVCDSLLEAVEYVYRVHGTRTKRIIWRLKLYSRCLPKMIRYWFQSWK